MRLHKITKEQIRIQQSLLNIEKCQTEKGLSKEIQKILSDHPKLANSNTSENFNKAQSSLAEIVSKMDYLIPELSRFIEQYLLDDRASILDDQEKKALHEAYVVHFEELTKKVNDSLKAYDVIIESLCENLLNIKVNIQKNLQEYVAAASGALKKVIAAAFEMGASGVLGFVGKEAAMKYAAGALAGGGVLGVALTAYSFIKACDKLNKAKKKNEAAINKTKIEGIHNVKEAEEQMRKIEEFVTKLVNDLNKTRKTLEIIRLEEEEGRNLNLIGNISKAMDEKINGENLSDGGRAQLLEGIKVAENTLLRFKKCL